MVARVEAALQALGQEQPLAKTALEEALKMAEEDVPKPVRPRSASDRAERLEAALKVLGEEDPDAEPLKAAFKQARIHVRVRAVGERLDLCFQYIARVKKQVARRGTGPIRRGSPEADGGEVGQWVAGSGVLWQRGNHQIEAQVARVLESKTPSRFVANNGWHRHRVPFQVDRAHQISCADSTLREAGRVFRDRTLYDRRGERIAKRQIQGLQAMSVECPERPSRVVRQPFLQFLVTVVNMSRGSDERSGNRFRTVE